MLTCTVSITYHINTPGSVESFPVACSHLHVFLKISYHSFRKLCSVRIRKGFSLHIAGDLCHMASYVRAHTALTAERCACWGKDSQAAPWVRMENHDLWDFQSAAEETCQHSFFFFSRIELRKITKIKTLFIELERIKVCNFDFFFWFILIRHQTS